MKIMGTKNEMEMLIYALEIAADEIPTTLNDDAEYVAFCNSAVAEMKVALQSAETLEVTV